MIRAFRYGLVDAVRNPTFPLESRKKWSKVRKAEVLKNRQDYESGKWPRILSLGPDIDRFLTECAFIAPDCQLNLATLRWSTNQGILKGAFK